MVRATARRCVLARAGERTKAVTGLASVTDSGRPRFCSPHHQGAESIDDLDQAAQGVATTAVALAQRPDAVLLRRWSLRGCLPERHVGWETGILDLGAGQDGASPGPSYSVLGN